MIKVVPAMWLEQHVGSEQFKLLLELPEDIVVSIYGNILKYGPDGDKVMNLAVDLKVIYEQMVEAEKVALASQWKEVLHDNDGWVSDFPVTPGRDVFILANSVAGSDLTEMTFVLLALVAGPSILGPVWFADEAAKKLDFARQVLLDLGVTPSDYLAETDRIHGD